ncbi:MAG: cztS, partial [Verrucomicrobiaceae bacterium]|nr:cztS [Verrucomicrobiaceae bacterium]
MTLRRRLSLWYGTMLVVCVLIAVLPTYDELILDAPNYSAHEVSIAHKRFRDVLHDMVLVAVPPVLAGIIGGWFLVRKALRPLNKVVEVAEKLDEHHLDVRLPDEKRDEEIERLAQVFNAMAERFAGSFQRVRDFTLNASHELKTPLAILRGEMETNLRTWPGLTEAQSNQIGSQIEEIDRLAKIVDGLTFLVKADAGQLQLAAEPVALHDLVSELLENAEILAQSRKIEVTMESCETAMVKGDRHRLRQVLLNLADNAIKYNQHGGWVKMA